VAEDINKVIGHRGDCGCERPAGKILGISDKEMNKEMLARI
jgi:hypothetical protein